MLAKCSLMAGSTIVVAIGDGRGSVLHASSFALPLPAAPLPLHLRGGAVAAFQQTYQRSVAIATVLCGGRWRRRVPVDDAVGGRRRWIDAVG